MYSKVVIISGGNDYLHSRALLNHVVGMLFADRDIKRAVRMHFFTMKEVQLSKQKCLTKRVVT